MKTKRVRVLLTVAALLAGGGCSTQGLTPEQIEARRARRAQAGLALLNFGLRVAEASINGGELPDNRQGFRK